MKYPEKLLSILLVCVSLIFFSGIIQAQKPDRPITIAVVQDGPAPGQEYVKLLESELAKHLQGEIKVVFKEDPSFHARWNPERYRTVIDNALNDPDVDILLLVGNLTTQEAARPEMILTKPVVSSYVQRSDLFDIPYSEEKGSLKKNLSFILIPGRIERTIQAFQRMIPFKTLHFALNREDIQNVENFSSLLKELEEKLKLTIKPIPITDDIAESLSQLDEKVEAVLVGRTPQLSSP